MGWALGLALWIPTATANTASAQDATGRALQRQQTEARITGLEERLGRLVPDGTLGELSLRMISRRTAFARKLLARNNQRAAKLLADQAESLLKAFEGRDGQQ
jgi:hypothetical protein